MPKFNARISSHVSGPRCTYCPGKVRGSFYVLSVLGHVLDTMKFQIRIPQENIKHLLGLIENALSRKKLTLKELHSLTASLQYSAKVMPSARAFIRRLYASMSAVVKPHHRIRLKQR